MTITPRLYQEMAISAALEGLRGPMKRALVVMATALGKTLTGAFIVQELKPKKVLFLVHSNYIIKDAMDDFALLFDRKTMAVYNGHKKKGAKEADVVFSNWHTMRNHLDEWPSDYFDFIIVDEAHRSEAETWKPVLAHFIAAKLALTATPDREDELDIRDNFGPEVINIGLEEAIARGWLPPIEYHVMTDESLDEDVLREILKEIRHDKKRFSMEEVNRRLFIKKRDEDIAKIIDSYEEKAAVFCGSIDHADNMASYLHHALPFHSAKKRKENKNALEAFDCGDIKRLTTVDAFNEGINIPSIAIVAFCRVTQSLRIFFQQLGRGMRPGKDKLIVLDFAGNLQRIQMVLAMMKRIEELQREYHPEIIQGGVLDREHLHVSGFGFDFSFSDTIVDLMEVLRSVEVEFYETHEEAKTATKHIGIGTIEEYHAFYKDDPKLPSHPHILYKEKGWISWNHFFDKSEKDFYPTLQEASKAAQTLGITSNAEYFVFYKDDPRLPSSPGMYYKEKGWTCWQDFLATLRHYSTYEQAKKAALALGITNTHDYQENYKKDPLLPSSPDIKYKDDGWISWISFLDIVTLYPTYEETRLAAHAIKIKSVKDYFARYKEDPRLPSNPNKTYAESGWISWSIFLEKEEKDLYPTYEEASKAAKELGLSTWGEYKSNHTKDPRLPANPDVKYKDAGWISYPQFLGAEDKQLYETYDEARRATIKLEIKTPTAYTRSKEYKKDPKLPSQPYEKYANNGWISWNHFLGKEKS